MRKLLFTSLLSMTYLHAGVEEVRIQWTPQLCNDICAKNLDHQFKRIYQLEEATVNRAAGLAILKYKPNSPYNYYDIERAMQMIGLTINDIRVTVTGRIKYSDQEVYLISDGDGSQFTLLSPVAPQPKVSVENWNPDSHRLSLSTRNELIEASKNGTAVTITGPLFEPERSPPNWLIVQSMKNAKAEEDKSIK